MKRKNVGNKTIEYKRIDFFGKKLYINFDAPFWEILKLIGWLFVTAATAGFAYILYIAIYVKMYY